MILEELFGSFLSVCSSLITQTPPISRQQRRLKLTFEETDDQDDAHEGLIHRAFEQSTQPELPCYDDGISASVQTDLVQPSRHFSQSLFRSLRANVGFITAVVSVLSVLTIFAVFADLNTSDVCVHWEHHNHSIPKNIKILRLAGWCITLLPLFSWFPACVAMLWGFQEFKRNYFSCLLVCQLVIGSISCVYRVIMFNEVCTDIVTDIVTKCRLVYRDNVSSIV